MGEIFVDHLFVVSEYGDVGLPVGVDVDRGFHLPGQFRRVDHLAAGADGHEKPRLPGRLGQEAVMGGALPEHDHVVAHVGTAAGRADRSRLLGGVADGKADAAPLAPEPGQGAVEVDHPFAPGPLQQVVYVLGQVPDPVRILLLQPGEKAMGVVGFHGGQLRPPVVVEGRGLAPVPEPPFYAAHLFDGVAAPQAVFAAKGGQAALGTQARAAEYE